MNGEGVGALPDSPSERCACPSRPLAPPRTARSRPAHAAAARVSTFTSATGKAVKDPHCSRALVVRYLCKRCGHVRRVYPEGFGSSRQSEGLKQLSVLLY